MSTVTLAETETGSFSCLHQVHLHNGTYTVPTSRENTHLSQA